MLTLKYLFEAAGFALLAAAIPRCDRLVTHDELTGRPILLMSSGVYPQRDNAKCAPLAHRAKYGC